MTAPQLGRFFVLDVGGVAFRVPYKKNFASKKITLPVQFVLLIVIFLC